ncbi:MAG TPA: DUF5131 family protein [Abditibacteriaceae bacterium]|jgi:protein gp37
MSSNTSIEWATKSWGITLGCDKKSDGCKNCYAIKTAWRLSHNPNKKIFPLYQGLVEKTKGGNLNWTGLVRSVPDRLEDPLHWKKPERIFVNSQSDLFHEDVPFEFIDRVFAVMALCPQHIFLILTKRPERMLEYLSTPQRGMMIHDAAYQDRDNYSEMLRSETIVRLGRDDEFQLPLPNVWLGVSIEDPDTANERLSTLRQIPAAVRWISYEPALQLVDFEQLFSDAMEDRRHTGCTCDGEYAPCEVCDALGPKCPFDWLVVGGESGADARPFDIAIARSTIKQCRAAKVPVFLKQLGRYVIVSDRDAEGIEQRHAYRARLYYPSADDHRWMWEPNDKKGGDQDEWPEDVKVREFPQVEVPL